MRAAIEAGGGTSLKRKRLGGRLLRWLGRYSAQIALVACLVYGAIFLDGFLSRLNLSAIASQYSIIGLLALGQLLVILTEGIDLSQGSMVALTSIILTYVMERYGLMPGLAACVLAVTLLGLLNGLLVSRTRIPAFVVTLGMLGIARGLALFISDTKPISVSVPEFTSFGRARVFEIPAFLLIWLGVAVLLAVFLRRRKLGRYIYAVGGSEESARLSGVRTRNVKLFVYVMSAFLTSVAGILWTARLSSGSPIGGGGYELESIAAVMVGGGSLFGGVGTVFGTVSGTLLFGVIVSILNLNGISPYWQGTLKGILILLAVALSQLQQTGARKG